MIKSSEQGEDDSKSGFHRGFTDSPRGWLYRHSKTGGWYWRLPAQFAPVDLRTGKKYLSIPLRTGRQKHATKSKNHAEAARRRLWRAWGQVGAIVPPGQVSAWIEKFRLWNLNKASRRQADYNARTVARFLESANINRLYEITSGQIDDYLVGLKQGGRLPRTLQAHRNTIGMFCKFLVRRGELDNNPAGEIELAFPQKRPPRYLTEKQIKALLKAASPQWLRNAICFAVYEGPRLSEIRQLRREDIKDSNIIITSTKTGDYRVVPIFPELRPTIDGLGDGDGFVFPQHDPRWWGQLFERITTKMPAFGHGKQWHLLRSTFAVRRASGIGLERPATLWELMAWLGHKNPQTTMCYVNIAQAAGVTK